ncbi:MAG: hypothetical protein KA130_03680, partial [Aeromonas sp.]|nr:hypothetical protein [Aeromonas sp.]
LPHSAHIMAAATILLPIMLSRLVSLAPRCITANCRVNRILARRGAGSGRGASRRQSMPGTAREWGMQQENEGRTGCWMTLAAILRL